MEHLLEVHRQIATLEEKSSAVRTQTFRNRKESIIFRLNIPFTMSKWTMATKEKEGRWKRRKRRKVIQMLSTNTAEIVRQVSTVMILRHQVYNSKIPHGRSPHSPYAQLSKSIMASWVISKERRKERRHTLHYLGYLICSLKNIKFVFMMNYANTDH